MIEFSIPAGRTNATDTSPAFTQRSAISRVNGAPGSPPPRAAAGSLEMTRRLESASSAWISARLLSVFDSSTTTTGTRLVPVTRLPPPGPPPKMTAKIEKKTSGTTNDSTWAARSRESWTQWFRTRWEIIRGAPCR
jgi:hypothetical protein